MSDIARLDSGVARVPLLGCAATRRREAALLAGLPPFTLMARAGAAVARLALAIAPHAQRVVVFAGPGNNGGDGVEAATQLAAYGKHVVVVRVGSAAAPPDDARRALARAAAAGIEVMAWPGAGSSQGERRHANAGDQEGHAERAGGDDGPDPGDDDGPDLVIDALLGIGASRPPAGELAAAITRIAELAARGAHVLAVDVPSGLDADRGRSIGDACVVADDTLTLIAAKPGLFTADGRDHAGRVWLAAIGAGDELDADADAWLAGTRDAALTREPRRQAAHKGSFGDVAVVGGAPGMSGAAWLAARAAHAAGAGRIFVELLHGADGQAGDAASFDPTRPELMVRPGWSGGDPRALSSATVVCGCGGGDAVRATMPRLLSLAPRLVLDADGLNALAADPSLAALLVGRHGRGLETILTPHPLEAARLLDSTTALVQADRIAAARALAARHRAVVVLKGSGTVVAAPDATPRIAATGNAALASAGTGDVLAGWIGGRWAATGAAPFDVATGAVVEHGAAVEPERPGAMRAADLVEALHRRARRR